MRLLAVSASIAFVAACDISGLTTLSPGLSVSPPRTVVVAWVGHAQRVTLQVQNTAQVRATVQAPQVAGAPAAFNLTTRAEGFVLGPQSTELLDVELRPDAGADGVQSEVIITLTANEADVAPVIAVLDVRVALPPPCAPRDPCETASFDPVAGVCVRDSRPDGEACDDDSACTSDDRCSAGVCLGRAVVCVDSVDCTVDTCDPARGCLFEPVHERCADENACTADTCVPDRGCERRLEPDGTPCGAFSCASFSTCFFGSCVQSPTPDGFPCEDGDLCTAGDECQAQACVPGDVVDPVASPPVLLARPTITAPQDARWFAAPEPDSADADEAPGGPPPLVVPPSINVALAFGDVLDVTQRLVGFAPTLVVVWKSAPFDVDGLPCSPWQMWQDPPPPGVPGFCATAVVATFVDEAALLNPPTGGVGTSVLLEVAYGTVDAAFESGSDALIGGDDVRVVVAQSTYLPPPAGNERELRLTTLRLSLPQRTATVLRSDAHRSGPNAGLGNNVHGGLRVMSDGARVELSGWDLPVGLFTRPNGVDAPGAREAPRTSVTLDVTEAATLSPGTRGEVAWLPLIADDCDTAALGAAREELAFADVAVSRVGTRRATLVRHTALGGLDGCGDIAAPTIASALLSDDEAGFSVVPLGTGTLAVGVTAEQDLMAKAAREDADGPLGYVLELRQFPYDPDMLFDPVVTTVRHEVAGDLLPLRVVPLSMAQGFQGAVVLEGEGGAEGFAVALSPRARLVLIDQDSSGQVTSLPSEWRRTPSDGTTAQLRALRSPLSPQSVYAVTRVEGDIDDGALVRFGCPFPGPPVLP